MHVATAPAVRGYFRCGGKAAAPQTLKITWRPWGELAYGVRTGKPAFDHVFDVPIFDYLGRHADAAAILDDAMTSSSGIDANAVVQAYDCSGIRTLVDVGGGQGLVLAAILKTNPHIRGILFELPHVIDRAAAVLQREGVADRCELVSGDFFRSVPEGGDAYLLKLVIHDWDDDRASMRTRSARPEVFNQPG